MNTYVFLHKLEKYSYIENSLEKVACSLKKSLEKVACGIEKSLEKYFASLFYWKSNILTLPTYMAFLLTDY